LPVLRPNDAERGWRQDSDILQTYERGGGLLLAYENPETTSEITLLALVSAKRLSDFNLVRDDNHMSYW